MKIHIFDVEHGECNAIETPSGHLFLIGTGHNSSTNWRPSTWVSWRNQRPHCIVLTNLDKDHLSDLSNFEPHLRPDTIKRNDYVNPQWIEDMKYEESGEVHSGVQTALDWMSNVFNGEVITPDYGMEKLFFYHSPILFQDTNNLSVVTFVRYNNIGIMFPGDIETAGWKEFLKDPSFVNCLLRTNILIASHHGRETGYCSEIFNYCRPDAVIISDKSIVHGTQSHDLYSQHCSGLDFGGKIRKVLTTRNDGKITIDLPAIGPYTVYINQSY
ncbi:hypothetical protein [Syntrophus aciditrophicus]|nr:hypothetical protein [Syntrophus aciditrophicus]